MRKFLPLIWLCFSLSFSLASSPACAEISSGTMTVAIRHSPPFAIKDQDGNWHGISIELWRIIADKLGLAYRFHETASLRELLGAVERGEAEAAVAAITITSKRETRMDFTHPFVRTGLGIAVPIATGGGWLSVTQRVVAPPFIKAMAALFGLLLLVGFLVWLLERRRNTQFGGTPVEGIGAGLWWSAVTMTTVGYGDKAPVTFAGRALAMIWMFAGVIVISSFTAAIATSLTVGELGGNVRGKDDLARARIATVAESTSAQFLAEAQFDFRTEPDLYTALDALDRGTVDAVVYDAPLLRYQVRQQFDDRLAVIPGSFEGQDYGIALPPGSPHREAINRVLLDSLRDPAWEKLLYSYLGKRD